MKIFKNYNDDSDYYYLVLNNMIKVILIHNTSFQNSSISLTVNAGTDNDPINMPGLTHLLEHVVFPTSNNKGNSEASQFFKFLRESEGSFNSSTSFNHSAFSWSAKSNYLIDAATLFAKFFANPVFEKDFVHSQLKVVHSKFLDEKDSVSSVKRIIHESLTEKYDPRGKHSRGSFAKLIVDKIEDFVREHWEKSYSSDGMCLVITGPQYIEELKNVAKKFECIQRRNFVQSSSCFIGEKQSAVKKYCFYDPKNYGSVVKINMGTEYGILYISLNTPSILSHFKQHLLENIKFLLTFNGGKGLMKKLIEKGLITDLSLDYVPLREYTMVEIIFKLTEQGLKEYKCILDMFATCTSTLKANQNFECFFKRTRIKKLHSVIDRDKMDYAESVACAMQYYEIPNVLNYEVAFENYDLFYINNFISYIADFSKWIITLVVKDDKDDYNYMDPHFLTSYKFLNKYHYQKLEVPHLREMQEALGIYGYVMPSTRAADSSNQEKGLLKRPLNADDTDEGFLAYKVFRSEVGENFTVINPKFMKNRGWISNARIKKFGRKYEAYNIFVSTETTYIAAFLKNNNMPNFFTEYEIFLTMLYERHLVTCEEVKGGIVKIESEITPEGMKISFYGPIKEIVKACSDFFRDMKLERPTNFEVAKAKLINKYVAILSDLPYNRLLYNIRDRMFNLKPMEERLKEIMQMTIDDVFMFHNYHLELLSFGNINTKMIRDLYLKIKSNGEFKESVKKLDPCVDVLSRFNTRRNLVSVLFKIQDAKQFMKYGVPLESSDLAKEKCRIYENECKMIKKKFIGELIRDILQEKFSTWLGENKRLGDFVVCDILNVMGTAFLSFSVQTTEETSSVKDAILEFIAEERKNLSKITPEDFETYKTAIIDKVDNSQKGFEKICAEFLEYYLMGYFDINSKDKFKTVIDQITLKELSESDVLDNPCIFKETCPQNIPSTSKFE